MARPTACTTLPVTVATVLLFLGLANIAQRASSEDVEDGVLWVQRSTGVVAAEVDPTSLAARAGVRAGDVLLAVDEQPIETRDGHSCPPASSAARHAPQLHPVDARRPPSDTGDPCANSQRRGRLVPRASRRGHLLAARRHHRSDAAPNRSGDTAFLLAGCGVLRRVHVLVHWSPRPRRLGVLLGGPTGHPVAAAALRALHARVSRAAARRCAGGSGLARVASALRPAVSARRHQGSGARGRIREPGSSHRHHRRT